MRTVSSYMQKIICLVFVVLLSLAASGCEDAEDAFLPSSEESGWTNDLPDSIPDLPGENESCTETGSEDSVSSADSSSGAFSSGSSKTGNSTKPSSSSSAVTAPPSFSSGTASSKPITASSQTPVSSAPARECKNQPELARELFDKINAYRISNGVSALIWRERNAEIAYRQAEYNAVNDVPDKAVHAVGEIGTTGPISKASDIPESALWHWQNSTTGHDYTLKERAFVYVGVSVFEIQKGGKTYEYVAIMHFDLEGIPAPDPGIKK